MSLPIPIFDLGGVLLRIVHGRFLETLDLDHTMDDETLLQVLAPDVQLYETGKLLSPEFFRRLSEHLHVPYHERRLHNAWYAILAGEVHGMRELLEQLRRLADLYLLSNTNELHFEYAKRTFPILRLFKQHFVSYKIGAMKPSPEIFHHVLHALRARPRDLVFVDDIQNNIEGARKVGIRGHLFTGLETLREMLKEEGFNIA